MASSPTRAATLSARKRTKRERIGLPVSRAQSHWEASLPAREAHGSIARSVRILATESRSRPTSLGASWQWSQKQDSISSTPFAGDGKRILSRKTPAKSYLASNSRSRRTAFARAAGLFGHTKRNVSSTPFPLSAQPPQPRLRSPRQFTTRSESSRPSISERTPYQSAVSSTGRRGPQNSRKTSGDSRKPTTRRSRSIAFRTGRTVSSIPSGSSVFARGMGR
jgi:hypothetical protein